MGDTLFDWLFLWLQCEDHQEYTFVNTFDLGLDEFSDAFLNQVESDKRQRDKEEWQETNWQCQREADEEADRQERARLERDHEQAEFEESNSDFKKKEKKDLAPVKYKLLGSRSAT